MASAKGARTGAIWGTGVLQDNQAQVLNQLGQGYETSKNYLQQGFDTAKGFLGQAQQSFAAQRGQAEPGMARYAALTTGSPQAMTAALEQTPGYQFSMDQGLQALNRRRAAGGMLNSGNADTDAMTFGSGLASQTLGAERAALMPYLGMYTGAQAGEAGTYGSMANAATGMYGGQAGLATDYFGNKASAYDDTAKNIVGLGTEALKAGDAAKAANQQMMLGAAGSITGLLGKAVGGGGMFSNLFGAGKVA